MAGKPRVHEVAAEYGIDSKTALAKLKEIGEFVNRDDAVGQKADRPGQCGQAVNREAHIRGVDREVIGDQQVIEEIDL